MNSQARRPYTPSRLDEIRARRGLSSSNTSNPSHSPPGGAGTRNNGVPDCDGLPPPYTKRGKDTIIIAVCGMTGTGKSTFIKKLTGQDVQVGHGLKSQTTDIQEVPFMLGSTPVTLVDTPGFDDTTRTDAEVFETLAKWLKDTFVAGTLLTGIIYLHRITDVRMTGAGMRNLTLFRKLCGEDNLSNVMLVTTRWEMIEEGEAEAREIELLTTGSFWKLMVASGSAVCRYHNDAAEAAQMVETMITKSPVAMAIQTQLVNEHKKLVDTDAGAYVNEEMIRMEKKHKEDLEFLEEELKNTNNMKSEEMRRQLEEQHRNVLSDMQKNYDARMQLLQSNLDRVRDESEQRVAAAERKHLQEIAATRLEADRKYQQMEIRGQQVVASLRGEMAAQRQEAERQRAMAMEVAQRQQHNEASGNQLAAGLVIGGLFATALLAGGVRVERYVRCGQTWLGEPSRTNKCQR